MDNNQSINNNQIREYNVDLLKTFSTICMIICHVAYMLGVHKEGYRDDFWYFFADAILGSYLAVAHAFMFAMGFGIIYSKRSSPGYLIKKGRLYYATSTIEDIGYLSILYNTIKEKHKLKKINKESI